MTDPNNQALTVVQGAGLTGRFTELTTDDVTGWALALRVVSRVGAAPLLALTVGAGLTVVDAAAGTIDFDLTPAQSAAPPPGLYLWTLERTDAGAEEVLAGGTLRVAAAATGDAVPTPVVAPPVYEPVLTAVYQSSLSGALPAAVLPARSWASVRVPLFAPSGRPAAVAAGGGTYLAAAAAAESASGQAVDAAAALAADGQSVVVTLPQALTDNPGVYELEARVLDSAGSSLARGRAWAYVEPSALGGGGSGPPPVDDVRAAVRDYPQANLLLGDYEFSAAEVAYAVTRAVRKFNAAPPAVFATVTTCTWPRAYRDNLLEGVLAELFAQAASYHRRGHLPYSAGGVAVDDLGKEKDYLVAAQTYRQRWDDWVKMTKVGLNIESAFGSSHSVYSRW